MTVASSTWRMQDITKDAQETRGTPQYTPRYACGPAENREPPRFWASLLYRWFVEYNPLYLLSAALVLAGCFLWTRGLVHDDGVVGPLGIAGVAEAYALALVFGAALLTRIGLRRPGVMLALLAIVYQWDATLHTETCACLGALGAWAAAAWLGLFALKLRLLAWALRIRFTRRARDAALLAAAGLAVGPRLLPAVGGRGAAALLAVWVFTLLSLHERGGIESSVELDTWGQTVLSRATRAAWLLSGALVAVHVFMWWSDHDLGLAPAILAVPLGLLRRRRSEVVVWLLAAGVLAVAFSVPSAFSITAALAALGLAARAWAPGWSGEPAVRRPAPAGASGAGGPYRAGEVPHDPAPHCTPRAPDAPGHVAAAVVGVAERGRLLTGAVFAAYVAAWTVAWSNGPWPVHVIPLDAALAVACVVFIWRRRSPTPVLPLSLAGAHLIAERRLLPVPSSAPGWGAAIVVLGFVLLAVSLLASYLAQARAGLARLPRWPMRP